MGHTVKLKKSNIVDKIPFSGSMEYGEVFVNYASGNGKSFLSTKKFDGNVAQFMEREYGDRVYSKESDFSALSSTVYTFSSTVINYVVEEASQYANDALLSANTYTDALREIVVTGATMVPSTEVPSVSDNILSIPYTDMSNYALSSDTYNAISDAIALGNSAFTYTETVHDALNSFSGEVVSEYCTKEESLEHASNSLANAITYTNEVFENTITGATMDESISEPYIENQKLMIPSPDLSIYALSSITYEQLDDLNLEMDEVTQNLYGLSANVITFSGEVVSDYCTKEESLEHASNSLANAITYTNEVFENAITGATMDEIIGEPYVENQMLMIPSPDLSIYALSSVTYEQINDINEEMGYLSENLYNLSGFVSTFSGNIISECVTKEEAISYASEALANSIMYTDILGEKVITGATMSYSARTVTISDGVLVIPVISVDRIEQLERDVAEIKEYLGL